MGTWRKFGDWNRASRLIRDLGKNMSKAQHKSLENFAEKAAETARGHIRNQDLGWQALSNSQRDRKARRGLSTDILKETGDYYDNITHWVEKDVAMAGIKEGVVNSEGKSLGMIAYVHEYGYERMNIPSRPLWRPTFAEVNRWNKKGNSPLKHFINIIRSY